MGRRRGDVLEGGSDRQRMKLLPRLGILATLIGTAFVIAGLVNHGDAIFGASLLAFNALIIAFWAYFIKARASLK